MKKIFQLLLFVFLSFGFANAQSSNFVQSYDVDANSNFYDNSKMILTNDSSYVLAFASYDSTAMQHTLELIKIGSGGQFLWRQSFALDVNYVQVAQAPDS